MYFLPRNNRIYSFIVHIRPAYRYLLTMLMLVLLGYIWFFGIYNRLDTMLTYYQSESTRLKEQQLAYKLAQSEKKKLEQSVATLQKQLESYAGSPQSINDKLQKSMTTVLESASAVGVTFIACTIDKEYDKQWYKEHAVTFEFGGSFERLMLLFETIFASKIMVTAQSIELQYAADGYYKMKCTLLLGALK